MLIGAVQRISGKGGDPVVQLQTNFGGGKTHSMLALYHLFSGAPPRDLPGIDAVLAEAGMATAAESDSRSVGWKQDLAGEPRNEARWHCDSNLVGRTGVAARRQEGV